MGWCWACGPGFLVAGLVELFAHGPRMVDFWAWAAPCWCVTGGCLGPGWPMAAILCWAFPSGGVAAGVRAWLSSLAHWMRGGEVPPAIAASHPLVGGRFLDGSGVVAVPAQRWSGRACTVSRRPCWATPAVCWGIWGLPACAGWFYGPRAWPVPCWPCWGLRWCFAFRGDMSPKAWCPHRRTGAVGPFPARGGQRPGRR